MVRDALGNGVSEAYYLGGQPSLSTSIDRLHGCRAALRQAGLQAQEGWVPAQLNWRTRQNQDATAHQE